MSAIARKVLALVGVIVLVFAVGYWSGLYLAPEPTTQVSQDQHKEPAADSHSHDHDHANCEQHDHVSDEGDDHDHDHDHGEGHDHDHGDDHHDGDGHHNGDEHELNANNHDHEHQHPDDDHEDVEHLALTKQAFDNLGLKLATISLQDYWKSQTIPGEVVEIPGRSKLTVSAPVTGVIDSVLVRPGQTIASSDRLFTLRITDENLTAAQSKLLSGVARAEIVRKEIARLAPLTASGAVAGRRNRDLEYELAQLKASQAVLRQEMRSRGLPQFMIAAIAEGRQLASTLEVVAPDGAAPGTRLADSNRLQPVSLDKTAAEPGYAVEEVKVHPGQAVERGDQLCTLSDHAELLIRGEAFETDMPLLDQLVEKDWGITAEFGHDHLQSDSQTITRSNLKLVRIDNSVGPESQTLTFFLPLSNEVAQTIHDDKENSFVHWRFKPGQRVHLRVPVEKWENQIVLPLDAVMIDGPNATVFVEHTHHGAEGDIYIELVPVPVHLLHRDDRFAVVASDGQLNIVQRVAHNAAYKLYQAMKLQAGGGNGHGHDHEH